MVLKKKNALLGKIARIQYIVEIILKPNLFMEESKNLRAQIHQLIAKNEIEQAFELLAGNQFTRLDKELIILNNRYNKVKEEVRMDVISKDEADKELNKINSALIDLSSKIESKPKVLKVVEPPKSQAIYYLIPIVLLILVGVAYMVSGSGTEPEVKVDQNELMNEENQEEIGEMVNEVTDEGIVTQDNNDVIEDKMWNFTLQKDDLESYEAYQNMFPTGRYIQEAQSKIQQIGEEKIWQNTIEKDLIDFYQNYLTIFPNGKYAAIAKSKISTIEEAEAKILQDNQDFQAATKTNTVEAFQKYLTSNPQGQHRDLAEANIKALETQKICHCPPKTFRTVSDHTWAEFRMPKAKMGSVIQIPEGVKNKYVFPKCNRTWWTNLVFSCDPNSCRWERISGNWDSDALCHGGFTPNKYLFVGER
ncbi:MAG: hypothetical protein DHS20C18_15740 [Saprospiraceae bacterium]|nr:MAG: hypothetical protein DHS20C18_15740 [Saprospiraceae bacterium]